MNYTDTKIWLNRYRNIKHKISHAEAMIDGLIKDQALISKYAYAVQSSNMSDSVSNIILKIEQIQEDYKDDIRENIAVLIETEAAIDGASVFPIKNILKLKYLELMPWSKISKYFDYRYSKDTLMKYHQQGIKQVMKYLNSLEA